MNTPVLWPGFFAATGEKRDAATQPPSSPHSQVSLQVLVLDESVLYCFRSESGRDLLPLHLVPLL